MLNFYPNIFGWERFCLLLLNYSSSPFNDFGLIGNITSCKLGLEISY